MTLRFRRALRWAPLALALLLAPSLLFAWGYWAHPRINRAAILALPAPLRTFFYDHADFLTESAIIPDLRKHVIGDHAEGPRHYCDLEQYKEVGKTIPRTPDEARTRYNSAQLDERGRLPWHLLETFGKLTKAMKDKRKSEILLLAADLGHYVGDAHMPLHTSENHDGQLTNQRGIHALWEARIPELYGEFWDFRAPEATYVTDPTAEVWRVIEASHAAADTLLAVDKALRVEVGPDALYDLDDKGNPRRNRFGQPYFSSAYAAKLQERLKGMVQRRLRGAIRTTANLWYTAWVDAGKPDLNTLDPEEMRRATAPGLQAELQRLQAAGQLTPLSTSPEY